MERRQVGSVETSAIGLGCMGMAGVAGMGAMYGKVDRTEAIATIHRAAELGIDLLDTAEVYGPYTNEELVAEAIAGRRDRFVLSTKFGFWIEDGRLKGVDSRPQNIRRAVDASLKRLSTDHIDIYFQHRVDPNVPIEDVVGTMAELKSEGKIRAIGLSEAGADTIRRAHATHPIDVLQSEYSLWERAIEKEILPLCRELGIAVMPYSPLGRGFLTGTLKPAEELPDGDYRKNDPRYQGVNFHVNMEVVEVIRTIAEIHGASPAQVAIAWLLAQGSDIVPIPGAKRRTTLEDTARAASLTLTPEDLAELETIARPGTTAGDRYLPSQMQMVGI